MRQPKSFIYATMLGAAMAILKAIGILDWGFKNEIPYVAVNFTNSSNSTDT